MYNSMGFGLLQDMIFMIYGVHYYWLFCWGHLFHNFTSTRILYGIWYDKCPVYIFSLREINIVPYCLKMIPHWLNSLLSYIETLVWPLLFQIHSTLLMMMECFTNCSGLNTTTCNFIEDAEVIDDNLTVRKIEKLMGWKVSRFS